MIKILVADDHQLVVEGIKLMLSEAVDINCIGVAHSGKQAIKFLDKHPTDVILLDAKMPGINGMEIFQLLQKKFPDVKTLMLSMLTEPSLIKRHLQQGVSGYLLKNANKEEVLKAIRKVYDGERYYSAELLKLIIKAEPKKVKQKDLISFPKLTRREKEILTLLVEGFDNKTIVERLSISSDTLETHLQNVSIKLNAQDKADLVKIATEYQLLKT